MTDPVSPPPRRLLPLALAGVCLAALLATVALIIVQARSGLSEQDARRACRTAFSAEWDRRVAGYHQQAAADSAVVIASVQGIDIQETWRTRGGYGVNGVIRYTLTTGVIEPVAGTVNLTCTASGRPGRPVIAVANR